VTRDLIQHQVNAVKGEMHEKVEKLSADAVRLDVVVSRAEQMRCYSHFSLSCLYLNTHFAYCYSVHSLYAKM